LVGVKINVWIPEAPISLGYLIYLSLVRTARVPQLFSVTYHLYPVEGFSFKLSVIVVLAFTFTEYELKTGESGPRTIVWSFFAKKDLFCLIF